MAIVKLKDFVVEQESAAQKAKDLQAKTNIEKQLLDSDKKISDIDLAIANLMKREKDGTLKKSESLTQQAIELQKKVAEMNKKAQAVKSLEALEK